MFSKGHVTLTQHLFSDSVCLSQCMLIEPQNFFAKKKPWIFISTQETILGMNYYTCYQCQVVYNSPECLYVQNN